MKDQKVSMLVFTALFAALIVVFAQLQIPMPGLVPISLATFMRPKLPRPAPLIKSFFISIVQTFFKYCLFVFFKGIVN